jgi:hypothetical protein
MTVIWLAMGGSMRKVFLIGAARSLWRVLGWLNRAGIWLSSGRCGWAERGGGDEAVIGLRRRGVTSGHLL